VLFKFQFLFEHTGILRFTFRDRHLVKDRLNLKEFSGERLLQGCDAAHNSRLVKHSGRLVLHFSRLNRPSSAATAPVAGTGAACQRLV
jgi:hypothetical protein